MPRIFTLAHPITNDIKYVGRTHNSLFIAQTGYINHSKKSKNKQLTKWIDDLRIMGMLPKIEEVEVVDFKDTPYAYEFWILQFKSFGFNLFNSSYKQKEKLKKRTHNTAECNIIISNTTIKFLQPPLAPVKQHLKNNKQFRLYRHDFICIGCGIEYEIRNLLISYTRCYCTMRCSALSRNKAMSDEAREIKSERMRESKYKPVIATKNGENYNWPSISDAAHELKCSQSTISNQIAGRGNSKTVKGYTFKFNELK